MSPTKRYLLKYAIVYIIFASAGLYFLGPPGLSAAYMKKHDLDHERYLEVVKSEPYILYKENPELHPLPEHLAKEETFVEQYESNPQYKAEEWRLMWFGLYFETFNALALIILAVHFSKKPLLAFLDDKRAEIRTRIDTAEKARLDAETQRLEAEKQVAKLDEERQAIASQGNDLVTKVAQDMNAETETILRQIDKEVEDRKHMEEQRARMQMKSDIVTRAMESLERQLLEEASEERLTALLQEFAQELERAQ